MAGKSDIGEQLAATERGDDTGCVDHDLRGWIAREIGLCLVEEGQPQAARPWFERAIASTERGNTLGRVDHEYIETIRADLAALGPTAAPD